jgi:hypothetical protein
LCVRRRRQHQAERKGKRGWAEMASQENHASLIAS